MLHISNSKGIRYLKTVAFIRSGKLKAFIHAAIRISNLKSYGNTQNKKGKISLPSFHKSASFFYNASLSTLPFHRQKIS